jgi:hypothetical protein
MCVFSRGCKGFCVGFFSWFWVGCVSFFTVDVDVVGFSCFSVLRVVLQGLIVATRAGSGLQQQQQLLFYAVDLSWFF